ncbi:TPA: nucleoside-diphosphate kinase [Streptococcus agalactiae]|nr:nucleoside-diphosphate kinase [Streptococcus agalactiae]
MEQTFFMIKPDGVKRGFIGEVISRIERRGFSIDRLEVRYADADILKRHYAELTDRPFFPTLVDYMTSGPVIIGVISGEEVISTWRTMMGSTNPKDALPGTIRGDFAQAPSPNQATSNIVHGSDSPESATREIAIWFNN